MLALIGTYRGLTYVPALMDSMEEHVTGLREFVFINDSPDPEDSKKLSKYGEVIDTHGAGYNAAMQAAVARAKAERDHVPFIEEDFTFIREVNFDRLAAHLDEHPYLAQIVLQREPWFEAEKEYGSIIEFHEKKRRQKFRDVHGFWEHNAFFSCNPGIWSRQTWASGWPEGEWSEDQKRLSLLKGRKKFALSKNVVVAHHGVRSGHGY